MLYKNITQEINGDLIKLLIKESATRHAEIKKLYERYKGTDEGVPIKTRKYKIDNIEQQNKINNKLANDFFSEIVDMKVGFFCGVPITYKNDSYELQTYLKFLTMSDIDLETTKQLTIAGYCGRLYYSSIDNNGSPIERIEIIPAYELIFVGSSMQYPDSAIRYYKINSYEKDGIKPIDYADVYTKDEIIKYKKDDNGNYNQYAIETHLFNRCPVIGFVNNEEFLGDAEKVLSLIDAYDRSLSDVNNENEQFRLAYLAITGAMIDEKTLEAVKQSGAFSLPDGATIQFITKNLNDAIIEHHLDRLERNIYRFSKTPNMNDANFSGNLTGIALKFKFRSFEDKCKVSELKFQKSLNAQFELLAPLWQARGIDIDPDEITYQFKRNYPQNLPEEAQLLTTLKGVVSEETALSLVSFVPDVQEEIDKLKKEKQENMDEFIKRSNSGNSFIKEPTSTAE